MSDQEKLPCPNCGYSGKVPVGNSFGFSEVACPDCAEKDAQHPIGRVAKFAPAPPTSGPPAVVGQKCRVCGCDMQRGGCCASCNEPVAPTSDQEKPCPCQVTGWPANKLNPACQLHGSQPASDPIEEMAGKAADVYLSQYDLASPEAEYWKRQRTLTAIIARHYRTLVTDLLVELGESNNFQLVEWREIKKATAEHEKQVLET